MVRYSIMQINIDRDKDHYVFFNRESVFIHGKKSFPPPLSLYDNVYGSSQESFDPNELIYIFNMAHPKDYRARSLSTSDIICYELPSGDKLNLYLNGTGLLAVDFGDDYKFAKKSEYEPGSDKQSGTVTLFYTKNGKIRTIRIHIPNILRKKFVGVDDDENEVKLTASEVYEALSVYHRNDKLLEGSGYPISFKEQVIALLF